MSPLYCVLQELVSNNAALNKTLNFVWTLWKCFIKKVVLLFRCSETLVSQPLVSSQRAAERNVQIVVDFYSLQKPWFSKYGFSDHWKVFCSWMKVKQKHSTSCLPREDMFPECWQESSQECWTRHRAHVTCSRVWWMMITASIVENISNMSNIFTFFILRISHYLQTNL